MAPIVLKSSAELIDKYDLFLFDAYGVLYDGEGGIKSAALFIEELTKRGKKHVVVTNDASLGSAGNLAKLRKVGVPVADVVTPCEVLPGYFERNGLRNKRCAVLGPEDTKAAVSNAGGKIVPYNMPFDLVVAGDETGYDLLTDLELLITQIFFQIEAKQPISYLLLNPDIIYPKAAGEIGITAGAIALLIENLIAHRFPENPVVKFTPLGKPSAEIFKEALRRTSTDMKCVMIGDQLFTDIRGANNCGIETVLVLTGLTKRAENLSEIPNYVLNDLTL